MLCLGDLDVYYGFLLVLKVFGVVFFSVLWWDILGYVRRGFSDIVFEFIDEDILYGF